MDRVPILFRSFQFWPFVISDGRIIGSQFFDEFTFHSLDLGLACVFGLPKNLFSSGEVSTHLWSELRSEEFAVSTPEVVDTIGHILTDIDLTVGVRNLVDDFHARNNIEIHEL